MKNKDKKGKIIGFITGEKGSIGKLQALALGVGGLMAGGLIPKITHAWDYGDYGDYGDYSAHSDYGDYSDWYSDYSNHYDYSDYSNHYDYSDYSNHYDYSDYSDYYDYSDYSNHYDYSDYYYDYYYEDYPDWENTWGSDVINYTPVQEPIATPVTHAGEDPSLEIGSGTYGDRPEVGDTTLIYVYEYDADGNITGGQEVVVTITSVGDSIEGGGYYVLFGHDAWEYNHIGSVWPGGDDGGGGGGDWSGDWPANVAPEAEVEVE